SAPQPLLQRRARIWQVLSSPIRRLQVPLLFRKVRLQHAEQAVDVGQGEKHAVARPAAAEILKLKVQYHKLVNQRPAREAVRSRRISRLTARFGWFSSLLPTP